MASTWRFTLCLCSVLLLLSITPSLASTAEEHDGTGSDEDGEASSPGSGTEHGEGGQGVKNITTLPIVSFAWHHVETPYLVALWILVGWLCKLGES